MIFFPDLLKRFFQGSLILFTPFILVRLYKANPVRKAYKSLPVFILLITYLVSVISFIAWFPRSYLFVLPLTVIFLAAGMVFYAEWVMKSFPAISNRASWFGGIVFVYIF